MNAFLSAFETDKFGTIWGGGTGNNSFLFRYTTATDKFENLSSKLSFIGDAQIEVNDLEIDTHGIVWLASNVGLIKYELGKFSPAEGFEEFQKTAIKSIAIDSDDRIWLGTENGVLLYFENQITRFGIEDGLPNLTTTFRASVIDNHDRLWFCTAHGLAFQKRSFKVNEKTPTPIFTHLLVNGKPINQFVPHSFFNNSMVDVAFLALTYPNKKVKYQYRIKNLTEEWSTPSYSSNAVFSALPEGNFTLLVRAQQVGYLWSEPAEFTFSIEPPWYLQSKNVLIFAGLVLLLTSPLFYLRKILVEKRWVQEQIKIFFSVSSDLLFIADFNMNVKYFNPRWSAIFGKVPSKMKANDFQNLMHPEDRQLMIENFRQLKKSNSS